MHVSDNARCQGVVDRPVDRPLTDHQFSSIGGNAHLKQLLVEFVVNPCLQWQVMLILSFYRSDTNTSE